MMKLTNPRTTRYNKHKPRVKVKPSTQRSISPCGGRWEEDFENNRTRNIHNGVLAPIEVGHVATRLEAYEEDLLDVASSNDSSSHSGTQEEERTDKEPDRSHTPDLVESQIHEMPNQSPERELVDELDLLGSCITDFALNISSEFDKHRSTSSNQIRNRQQVEQILQEKKATKYLSATLGDSIYNNLINHAKHQRPEIVRRYVIDAIRCLGSTISHHIIEDTCPGLPNEGKDLISKFGKMISKETQTKSLHLRELEIRRMYREDTRKRTEDRYKEDLALYTECIMILTGENIDSPLLRTVSDLSRNSGIIEHASNLSNKIKKNIFSADLVTFCPRPGWPFNLEEMDAEDDGEVGKEGDRVVLCCIEPGLREITSGVERSGQDRVLLKAKVVLKPFAR